MQCLSRTHMMKVQRENEACARVVLCCQLLRDVIATLTGKRSNKMQAKL